MYQRRPSLRQLGYLYGNVITTSLAATQIERVDLTEYVQPVLTGVLGQSFTTIPGASAISGHVTNALFQGSVNAFLTLRVAMIAIAYSGATVKPHRATVWSGALARAGQLLVRTVANGTADVVKAFVSSVARSTRDAAVNVGTAVVKGGQRVGTGISRTADAVGAAAGQAAKAAGAGLTSGAATVADAAKSIGRIPRSATENDGTTEPTRRRRRRKAETET